tara:strand:- start:582 stop:1856 length:1275 start_codon:yes stop_codon:yes gene_type:complete
MEIRELKLAIIGLGYVGLPLAVEFGNKLPVIGFDLKKSRIEDLTKGIDNTREVSAKELKAASYLHFTDDESDLADANFYIIAVPTPIDRDKNPDLEPLMAASQLVGSMLQVGDIVVYESTVYPGCTEDDCVPILEVSSGLKFNRDFFCGYSPERVNPGDPNRRISMITKVTSGSTPEIALIIDNLYKKIITAGTHMAPSIKVAEAAKIIENTQRDLNIALMNELSIIFNKMEIDTESVLEAASTKWNFLPFKPGLVGGHCIGVDPYYLTHKSKALGYNPEIILAGRKLNDNMPEYITKVLTQKLNERNVKLEKSNVLILGLAFKENCPDVRNTKVVDLVLNLLRAGAQVHIYDPLIDLKEVSQNILSSTVSSPKKGYYDAVILAVPHEEFIVMGKEKIKEYGNLNAIFCDLKSKFELLDSDFRL